MKKIKLETTFKKLLADVYTPVGIYLRLRDRFRDTILLESTDHHAVEDRWSFMGNNTIAGIEIIDTKNLQYKLPGQPPVKVEIKHTQQVPGILWEFMQRFQMKLSDTKEARFAQ